MVLQYLLWKSDRTTSDFSSLAKAFASDTAVRLKAPDEDFIMRLIDHVEGLPDLAARRDRLHRIGRMLDVDVATLERDGLFFLMTREVIHGLAAGGVDIQLYTHRHRPGLTREVFHREIADNISAMKDFGVEARRHFCYPSGQYSAQHMSWLREWGIRSATTCDPGFNDRGTNPLALRRFLDGENISQIEFEAEIYGFAEILRKIKGLLRRPSAPPAPAPPPDSETA